jgi:hypothetical protein
MGLKSGGRRREKRPINVWNQIVDAVLCCLPAGFRRAALVFVPGRPKYGSAPEQALMYRNAAEHRVSSGF